MTPALAQKGPESAARLAAVNRWSALALALYSFKVYDDATHGEPLRAGLFLAAIVLHTLNLVFSLKLLRRGRFDEALNRTLLGGLIMFAVGGLHADNNPSTAVLPVVLVAIALPYVGEARLIRYSLWSLAALLFNVVMYPLFPLTVQETGVERAAGHIFATTAAAGVALLLFWQIKESLNAGQEARRRAKEAAELEEERYRSVLESTGEGIWLLGEGADTLIMNEPMKRLLGEAALDELADWILGFVLKDEPLEQEIQVKSAEQGQTWLLISACGLRSLDGFLEGALVTATDVTELKRARLRIARSLGVEAEGRLAGGITHDMNNVLAVMRGSCDMLKAALASQAPDPAVAQALAKIDQATLKATALVGSLLSSPGRAPRPAAPESALPAAAPQDSLPRVLLVDDDDDVRGMAARALRADGCDVLEASGADGARKVMDGIGDSVGLLVTDVMMPVISGTELAAELKKKHPGLRVLFISGYAGEYLGGQEKEWPEEAFLAKPFSPADLCKRVRRALGL